MRNPVVCASLLCAALLAAGGAAAQTEPTGEPGTEPVGFHGMLVLGQDTIYASHLPMFTAFHRYQAIWEVSFGPGGDEKYRAARALPANAREIFTLAPREKFRLPELMAGRTSFKADVFVGHFERPGHKLLLGEATVTIVRSVHFHPFLRRDRRPEALTYVVFGKGRELFLAHRISVAPNFDQILAVSPVAAIGDLPAGAVFTLPGRVDTSGLPADQSFSGQLSGDDPKSGPGRAVELRVSSEVYLEEGELASNDLPPRP